MESSANGTLKRNASTPMLGSKAKNVEKPKSNPF